MPTYVYKCLSCRHTAEYEQKMSEQPIIICPHCKNNTYVRVIPPPSIHFKGNGFYETDYKKKG